MRRAASNPTIVEVGATNALGASIGGTNVSIDATGSSKRASIGMATLLSDSNEQVDIPTNYEVDDDVEKKKRKKRKEAEEPLLDPPPLLLEAIEEAAAEKEEEEEEQRKQSDKSERKKKG